MAGQQLPRPQTLLKHLQESLVKELEDYEYKVREISKLTNQLKTLREQIEIERKTLSGIVAEIFERKKAIKNELTVHEDGLKESRIEHNKWLDETTKSLEHREQQLKSRLEAVDSREARLALQENEFKADREAYANSADQLVVDRRQVDSERQALNEGQAQIALDTKKLDERQDGLDKYERRLEEKAKLIDSDRSDVENMISEAESKVKSIEAREKKSKLMIHEAKTFREGLDHREGNLSKREAKVRSDEKQNATKTKQLKEYGVI